MTYEDLIRTLEPRFRRIGLPQDGTEILALAVQEQQKLCDRFDFDAFVDWSNQLIITVPSIESYRLPVTFGRLMLPKREGRCGLMLWDGSRDRDLAYEEPMHFHAAKSDTTGTPSTLTIQGGRLWLKPIPDDAYTIRGHFIMAFGFPNEDDRIPFDTPGVLVSAVLSQAAMDTGIPQAAAFAHEARIEESVSINTQAKYRAPLWQRRSWRHR